MCEPQNKYLKALSLKMLSPMRIVRGLDIHKDSVFAGILNENGDIFEFKYTAFSFKKYCSSLVLVIKILIFVRSDAEAPP